MFTLSGLSKRTRAVLIQSIESGFYDYSLEKSYENALAKISEEIAERRPLNKSGKIDHINPKDEARLTLKQYSDTQIIEAANGGLEWPLSMGYVRETKLEITINIPYTIEEYILNGEAYNSKMVSLDIASITELKIKETYPNDTVHINVTSAIKNSTIDLHLTLQDDARASELESISSSVMANLQNIYNDSVNEVLDSLVYPPNKQLAA